MPESVAATQLREVLDALSAHDLDRVAAVVDERFEFLDVGGGEVVHSRNARPVGRAACACARFRILRPR